MDFDLIQRASTKTDKPSQIQGIDSFLDFDYMGSAEFEFGALPKALRTVCASLPHLCYVETGLARHDGARLYLVFDDQAQPVGREAEILDFLKAQYEGTWKGRLKERTSIGEALRGDKYASRLDCWWDIENDWFAIVGKKQAENLLLALRKVKEKKGW